MTRASNTPAASRAADHSADSADSRRRGGARRLAESLAAGLRAFAKSKPAGAQAAKPAAIGKQAEAAAAAFLQKRGLRLIRANYRVRGGEIDLIMRDGAAIVFVEVRRRANPAFGGAAASITARKRRKLAFAAARYLAAAGGGKPARFDAVLLDGRGQIRWQKNIAVEAPY